MRAVVAFCVFMALAAFVLQAVNAQPPRHESIIIMYNDSACTQHLRTERIPLPSSTKCEVEEFRMHNMSSVFECDTANNVTHLIQQVYNNTLMCDNTPVVAITSAAPAHTCAAISVTYEGQKSLVYGHVECAPPNMTNSIEAAFNIKTAAASVPVPTAKPSKSFFASLFNL